MVERRPELTPKQLGKREQIICAARIVLLRDGLSGVTSRAVARQSGLTNGLIHYYFDTLDEIVDAVMEGELQQIIDRIREAAAQNTDPIERFWAVTEAHLDGFAHDPTQALIWMDYWAHAMHSGQTHPIERIDDLLVELLTGLLEEAGLADAADRAQAICSYVTGAGVRSGTRRLDPVQIRRQIAVISGYPPDTKTAKEET
jgi:AcrR family transcriptional regulator